MRMSRRLLPGLLVAALCILPLSARGAEVEKYVPNATDALVAVNVKLLLDAPLVKNNLEKIKPALKADAEMQKTFDDLGLDPFKDVESVVFAVPPGGDFDRGLIVIQGKFNLDKIHSKADQVVKDQGDKLSFEKLGQVRLYKVTPSPTEDARYAALLDDNFLVASKNRDLVEEAIEKKQGKKKQDLKKELTQLIAKADPKQGIQIIALEGTLNSGQGRSLEGLGKALTGGVTLAEDVKFDFVLATKDDKAATKVADALDQGLGQVKVVITGVALQDKRLAPVIDILNSFKSDASGANVTLKGQVTKEVIEKLEKVLKEAAQEPKKDK